MTIHVTGLLSWFDEPVADLERLIRSLPTAGVDTLVALDGRYATFPAHEDTSADDQYDTIHETCRDVGIDAITIARSGPWPHEIAKRTALFHAGENTPADWFYVCDGDEQVMTAPHDLRRSLSHTLFDVATVELHGRDAAPGFPKYFRAGLGLHVVGNHYTYRTNDGRYLWGNARTTRLEARHPLDMHVMHHTRTITRRTQAVGYYAIRDATRAENHNPMRLAS